MWNELFGWCRSEEAMSTRDERREFIALSEACAMRDALGAAETVEQLAALWAAWLGTLQRF